MKLAHIDAGRAFDWGHASADYAKYRDIYPDPFYQHIVDLGIGIKGQIILDLGTGTGVLPRHMYKYGAAFVGTDISENQIRYATQLSDGMDIDYIVSSAEDLDFAENTFDAVTACQCFMYFDTSIIIPKIHKWLKPNGHLLILFMDWLPDESTIAKTSEELVLKFNPQWTGGGKKRCALQPPAWSTPYFEVTNAVTYDIAVPFTRKSWNGRMKACRGIDASLSPEMIAAFEKAHKAFLSTVPEEFVIPHFASILDLQKK